MKIAIPEAIDIGPRPDQYILNNALIRAVETALRFNQPLLLTGEPGTGKTQLAYKVADMLNRDSGGQFSAVPLRFNTKTTSKATDLFYTYNALGHFQQANLKDQDTGRINPTKDFIELEALGEAIARANPKDEYSSKFIFKTTQPTSSVVLIDEVDKAPRDFTNDILNEIENREFFVREQKNYPVSMRGSSYRVLIIMTSNSEKNLPDAFLRRCVFFHIPIPEAAQLKQIVQMHLSPDKPIDKDTLSELADTFIKLREALTRKPPATAEFVAFSRILEIEGLFDATQTRPPVKQMFEDNLSLLVKTREDLDAAKKFLRGLEQKQ